MRKVLENEHKVLKIEYMMWKTDRATDKAVKGWKSHRK